MRELYYSWYSICSEKVLICLLEKDLPFEDRHIDLFDFDQVKDDYLSINPAGVVPTLVDGGRPIAESTIINEYLEDVAPQPRLRPRDPHRCAEMRSWVQRFQDIVFPAVGLLSQVAFIAGELNRRWPPEQLEVLIRRKVSEERVGRQLRAVQGALTAEEVSSAVGRVERVLVDVERLLGDGRDWLAGSYSLADAAAAPNLYRLDIIGRGEMVACRPAVAAWYRRMTTRTAFLRTYEYSPSVRPV
ncbi:MAG: glutathione S-transferase family protein [Defluviicoccus sp.]|nr:glutathione S-transferase family protein [Defluviicoccus sp.]MDE0385213.1 glutathione S-transferase family protein [Defluviicoccus sp.]